MRVRFQVLFQQLDQQSKNTLRHTGVEPHILRSLALAGRYFHHERLFTSLSRRKKKRRKRTRRLRVNGIVDRVANLFSFIVHDVRDYERKKKDCLDQFEMSGAQ